LHHTRPDTIGGLPTSFSSLTEIDPHEWDRLAGDNAFATYGWLLTVEQCSRARVEPLYFLHRENGIVVATAVCYVASASNHVETLDHMIYGRAAGAARALRLSVMPALVCGPALGYGWHIGLDDALEPVARQRVRASMIDAMESAARDRGLELSFVHLMDRESELAGQLRQRGYLRCANVPVAVLDVRWATFDAYLDDLPQRTRSEFRRQMKHNRAAGTVIDVAETMQNNDRRALELFDANQWKHSRLRFAFDERSFASFDTHMRGRAKLLTATKAAALTGACLVLNQGTCGYAVAVGIDQARAGDDYTYFHLTYNSTIADAIASGLRRVYYGRGLYEVKLRRGCTLENTWLYSHASGAGRVATAAWFGLASFWNRLKLPPRARRLLPSPSPD
jgi:predicted N-acyltransferase